MNSIPFSAPFPVPTIIAVGVASPRAHGQAIISTATNVLSAKLIPSMKYHIIPEIIAMLTTTGTKYALIVSASFCIGALLPCASSTSFIICESIVSDPTFVALNLKLPVLLIVPPITVSPFFFSIGMLSPVIMLSSIVECPSIMTPSTGIFCPGFTSIVSPFFTSSIGISVSSPSLMIIAVFGVNPISFFIASLVFPFALSSRVLPSSMNIISIPATSKYNLS